jgi:hypothetical protein
MSSRCSFVTINGVIQLSDKSNINSRRNNVPFAPGVGREAYRATALFWRMAGLDAAVVPAFRGAFQ